MTKRRCLTNCIPISPRSVHTHVTCKWSVCTLITSWILLRVLFSVCPATTDTYLSDGHVVRRLANYSHSKLVSHQCPKECSVIEGLLHLHPENPTHHSYGRRLEMRAPIASIHTARYREKSLRLLRWIWCWMMTQSRSTEAPMWYASYWWLGSTGLLHHMFVFNNNKIVRSTMSYHTIV